MTEARTKRRIGVMTTSRADYSHLYWPLRELAAHPHVELGVFALGAHLSPQYGSTIHQIERDGFPIRARIECLLSSDTDTGMAKTIGLAILGLADGLAARPPAAHRGPVRNVGSRLRRSGHAHSRSPH
jgi:UDP-N-acetylglucosamine 2-epimerase (non-hydrolysing)/GDP/UDP-N,N'-diacetylbacillosamine 2-epimerase (hydrolysing)